MSDVEEVAVVGGSRVEEWDAQAYAIHAGHHRDYDEWFLDRHRPRPGDEVVDLGCGTGEFTERLGELVAEGNVIGVEPDPSMLETARERVVADNVEFREGRAQDLDRVCAPASIDLVVSRAMFHWIPLDDYRRSYAAIHTVLRPGGWFHAESGGTGNCYRVREELDTVAAEHGLGPATVSFPHPGRVLDLLEDAGFEVPPGGVRTVAQRRPFDRDQLVGFLETQATTAYLAGAPDHVREAFMADAVDRADELRRDDGSYDQTFVRLEVLCRRPD